jgi:hypothetical protein
MKNNNTLLIYLMKHFSNYYWYIIDNLTFKLDKFADKYYKKSIGKEYYKEYKAFGILNNNNVLHIGSGAYPLTEITLAETIGANVVGIDSSIKAVDSANYIVTKKELHDKIIIKHGNGIDYPVIDFDVIIVSSCASPMIKIIKHIFKSAKVNTKIIIREMETSIKPIESHIEKQNNVFFLEKIDHNPFPFIKPFGWKSLHFSKRN